MDTASRRFLRAIAVAVRNGVQSFQDYYEREHDPLTRDALTSVFNRHIFERRRKKLYSYSLILLDVDNFKAINDHYGHSKGDVVLRAVASALRVSSGDRVFRIGGEEFAVLLSGCALEDATKVARRLCEKVESLDLIEGRRVTVSAGIAWAGDPTAHDETYRNADKALYHAKTTGKNRAARFDSLSPAPALPCQPAA